MTMRLRLRLVPFAFSLRLYAHWRTSRLRLFLSAPAYSFTLRRLILCMPLFDFLFLLFAVVLLMARDVNVLSGLVAMPVISNLELLIPALLGNTLHAHRLRQVLPKSRFP